MRILPFLVFTIVLSLGVTLGQANSVDLKDGGGTLIGSYPSITAAYAAIDSPMTHAYLIELKATYDGTSETFPILLTQKEGASNANRITIRPAAGIALLSLSATVTNNSIFYFNGGDYITIDGRAGGVGSSINFYIENTTATGSLSNTILIQNGATNIDLKFLHMKNNLQNTAGPRVILLGTSASNPEGNSNISITNCKLEGSRSGIASSGTAANPNRNILIENCEIYDWGYAGIWLLSACTGVVVKDNLIYEVQGYNNTIVTGISVGSIPNQSLTISGNKIWGMNSASTSSTSMRGIVLTAGNGADYFVYNNFISLMENGPNNVSACYGTLVSGTASNKFNLRYAFNTVRIGGVHSGGTAGNAVSGAFIKTSANDSSTIYVMNNIFQNTRTGNVANAYHVGSFVSPVAGIVSMDYNATYSTGSVDNFAAGWGSSGYNVIGDYQTAAAPFEAHTIFKGVSFVSPTDLHLAAPSDIDADLQGVAYGGIIADIDNDPRNPATPFRGADEGQNPIPVELASFVSSVTGNSVLLKWSTATEKNNNGFEIQRSVAGGEWTNLGFVKGQGTTVGITEYSFADNGLQPGKYSYRLKQVDYDGTFEYHNLAGEVSVGVPENFGISQNYPNPFNPSTKIDFAVSEEAAVKIELFDISGAKVADLFNSTAQPGYYSVLVDIQNLGLSSGNYLYRYTATRVQDGKVFNFVKKLTVLK
ncbi:MAG: right-handed parallel beta-helix repeat-containing protein [Ignavibacteria bacterium]|nr:right-handed parallel beta-helix repeat-containing protein [Ignavibacteria bacterium]MBZ0195935.1 T9SS type A sorting domain-containing protein [Ignavibacteriaceae bacterium]